MVWVNSKKAEPRPGWGEWSEFLGCKPELLRFRLTVAAGELKLRTTRLPDINNEDPHHDK